MSLVHRLRVAVIAAGLLASFPAFAIDKVRVADAQRGFWDTTVIAFGVQKGIFRDAGLDVDILWTDGGSDAQQSVISGAIDVAYDTGTLGVLGAWEQGAPIAVIAAAATGSTDYLWYVKKDSPIQKADDLAGKKKKGRKFGLV
jgi:NitT/TauT family transport system substrate-binding protein